MNFKYFHLVIIAHLLSGRWSIAGQSDKRDIDEEFLKIIKKFPPNPVDPYDSIKIDLIELKGFVNGMCNELRRSLQELDRLKIIEERYNEIRPGLKIRDSIEDIERKQFPLWLNGASIHRYFKWMIALDIVQTPFFVELRQQLNDENITYRRFSTVMCELYDTVSGLFAHRMPIGKPTCQEFETFCHRFLGESAVTKVACKTLAKPVPPESCEAVPFASSEADPNKSTITLKYKPRFNIVIKEIKFSAYSLDEEFKLLNETIVEIPEFKTYKCTIKHANILQGDVNRNMQSERSARLHDPCFFFRIDADIDLWAKDDKVRHANFNKYTALKQFVRKVINEKYNPENKRSDLIIIADDDYSPRHHSTTESAPEELAKTPPKTINGT